MRLSIKKPSPAFVIACVALFVSLGSGAAYAANTVFSTDIVDGQVTTPDLADQGEAMLRVIDQIDLTALNAAARSKGDSPAHATLPSPDSPRYREAVAEYYRRLGNR